MPEYMHTYVRYASDVVACDAKGPVFPKKLHVENMHSLPNPLSKVVHTYNIHTSVIVRNLSANFIPEGLRPVTNGSTRLIGLIAD